MKAYLQFPEFFAVVDRASEQCHSWCRVSAAHDNGTTWLHSKTCWMMKYASNFSANATVPEVLELWSCAGTFCQSFFFHIFQNVLAKYICTFSTMNFTLVSSGSQCTYTQHQKRCSERSTCTYREAKKDHKSLIMVIVWRNCACVWLFWLTVSCSA